MNLNSFSFFLFFGVVFSIYWCLDYRKQNILLFIASYFFYAVWGWWFPFLLGLSSVVDYFCGLRIFHAQSKPIKKRYLCVSVVFNLAVLGFFKYSNFFIDNVRCVMHSLGFDSLTPFHLHILLPIGISFSLLKSMSYTIDIYSKVIKEPETNFFNYATYVSFFPQLLAGPIERATHFLPQLAQPRKFRLQLFYESCFLIFWGLFKKCVIADNLVAVVQRIFHHGGPTSGFEILLGMYANIFQIYADFSGYSDIAIGIAGCLGFTTIVNFNLPFFAKSPAEIWRRWHISLSSWVRDYLFYSLGGLRTKGIMLAVITLVTMSLMGLWHGARWAFIIWGLYHGSLLIVQAYVRKRARSKGGAFRKPSRFRNALKIIGTFNLLALGGVVFFVTSWHHFSYFTYLIIFHTTITHQSMVTLGYILFYTWLLIAVEIYQYNKGDQFAVLRMPFWIKVVFYFIVLTLFLMCGVTGSKPFVYMQF
jgi:alginate O-acetyltransferase complex protein AlgI